MESTRQIPPTATTDRQCKTNVCQCPGGVPVTNCPREGMILCDRCTGSFYKHGNQCYPWSNCGINDGRYQTVSPTNNQNRSCDSLRECTRDEYETKPPVKDSQGRHIGNRTCTALTKCDGAFEREKKAPHWNGKRYTSNRTCLNYIPSGKYSMKRRNGKWCADEHNNAIRCTRGEARSHEKYTVHNIGEKNFTDKGGGYIQFTESYPPHTYTGWK